MIFPVLTLFCDELLRSKQSLGPAFDSGSVRWLAQLGCRIRAQVRA